jgi:hypothetical protein
MPKRHDPNAALRKKIPRITGDDGVRRFIALFFQFYKRCENRQCRRAEKCCGESRSCFNAFWWDMPEYQKVWFRAMIEARAAGAKTAAEIEKAGFEAAKQQLLWEMEAAERAKTPIVAQGTVSSIEPLAHNGPRTPDDAQGGEGSQSGVDRRGPRVRSVTTRVAYNSVMFR